MLQLMKIKDFQIILKIFSSEEATTAVNIIVIFAFVVFLVYIFKLILSKFQPDVQEKDFFKQIETSSSYQNVFAFSSVVLASTLFELFTDEKYRMIWVVLVISVTTILFHLLYEKIVNTNFAIDKYEQYNTNMKIIDKIMDCKGYSLILNTSEIEKIENDAREMYIFTEDLTTDIPIECVKKLLSDGENIGLYTDLVSQNIPKGKHYTYFLKDNSQNRLYVKEYFNYHFSDKKTHKHTSNINFYFVKESGFTFFTEIYFYKNNNKPDLAFEWLPAIGETNNINKQFYLKLDSEQVENINEIIIELSNPQMRYTYRDYLEQS